MPSPRLEAFLRRGALVTLCVGGVQALVIAVGWYFLYATTHEQVAEGVEELIIDSNERIAKSLADAIGEFAGDLEFGTSQWDRAQGLVEDLDMAGDGFACILDEQGKIVCHPDIRSQPGLREVNLSEHMLVDVEGKEGALRDSPEAAAACGAMRFFFDGKHYIATRRLNEQGVRVLVHQPVSGLTAASSHLTRGLVTLAGVIGLLIVGLTWLVATGLTRMHDRAIVLHNYELDDRVQRRTAELMHSHEAIIFALAKLAECRDNETGMHVERMCAYSKILAQELQRRGYDLDDRWVEMVELAASLHDIGKVAIPDRILKKPGRLTDEEMSIMRTHTLAGAEALEAVRDQLGGNDLLDMGIDIALGHHERWDGTGYPNRVGGEDIPLAARVVSVADVFDALASKRVYKAAMSMDEVLRIIHAGSGSHFDPAVVAAMDAALDQFLDVRERMGDPEPLALAA